MKEPWFVFYDKNDKELAAFTARGSSVGEIAETKKLLAYEHDLNVEDISHKIVIR